MGDDLLMTGVRWLPQEPVQSSRSSREQRGQNISCERVNRNDRRGRKRSRETRDRVVPSRRSHHDEERERHQRQSGSKERRVLFTNKPKCSLSNDRRNSLSNEQNRAHNERRRTQSDDRRIGVSTKRSRSSLKAQENSNANDQSSSFPKERSRLYLGERRFPSPQERRTRRNEPSHSSNQENVPRSRPLAKPSRRNHSSDNYDLRLKLAQKRSLSNLGTSNHSVLQTRNERRTSSNQRIRRPSSSKLPASSSSKAQDCPKRPVRDQSKYPYTDDRSSRSRAPGTAEGSTRTSSDVSAGPAADVTTRRRTEVPKPPAGLIKLMPYQVSNRLRDEMKIVSVAHCVEELGK